MNALVWVIGGIGVCLFILGMILITNVMRWIKRNSAQSGDIYMMVKREKSALDRAVARLEMYQREVRYWYEEIEWHKEQLGYMEAVKKEWEKRKGHLKRAVTPQQAAEELAALSPEEDKGGSG